MNRVLFNGREAVRIENEALRVTVLSEGGHIAEVYDKRAGVNPLWSPPWPSMEPSAFDREQPARLGTGSEAKLLAGIMGHNLCLDLFGGPSEEEAAAGLTVHGEASVNRYEITESKGGLDLEVSLPMAQLRFLRSIELHHQQVQIRERVENLTALDRPLAWTQHVTLSPPFLDPASTEFRASMARSMVIEGDPGLKSYLRAGAEFTWPLAPRIDGGQADLRKMHGTAPASAYTAHAASVDRDDAYFVAFSAQFNLAFAYIWRRADFPWLGIWEENCSRPGLPWSSQTITRGMEFGVSPFPETRRAMVDRGSLFGIPGFKWLPANGHLDVEYWITSQIADRVPEEIAWPTS